MYWLVKNPPDLNQMDYSIQGFLKGAAEEEGMKLAGNRARDEQTRGHGSPWNSVLKLLNAGLVVVLFVFWIILFIALSIYFDLFAESWKWKLWQNTWGPSNNDVS